MFLLCKTNYCFITISQNRVVKPRRASSQELSAFHSFAYIECLEQLTNDDCEEVEEEASEYGLGM